MRKKRVRRLDVLGFDDNKEDVEDVDKENDGHTEETELVNKRKDSWLARSRRRRGDEGEGWRRGEREG